MKKTNQLKMKISSTFRLDSELKKKAQKKAHKQRKTLTEVIEEKLTEYVEPTKTKQNG